MKNRRILGCALVLVVFIGLHIEKAKAAVGKKPDGWSNTKTNDADTMFTVKPGEKITFYLKGTSGGHVWTVNKQVQAKAKGGSLTWAMPNAKGIWEIHVRAGRTHAEWVVSTLTKAEAPDFFDYFADSGSLTAKLIKEKRRWYHQFERSETDPWGRPLPKWIAREEPRIKGTPDNPKRDYRISNYRYNGNHIFQCYDKGMPDIIIPGRTTPRKWYERAIATCPDTSCGYLQPPATGSDEHILCYLRADGPKGMYGTWKFRFRFPNGPAKLKNGWTHFCYMPFFCHSFDFFPFWYLFSTEGHQHFKPGAVRNGMDFNSSFSLGSDWYEGMIIRTKDDHFYSFINGQLQFCRINPRRGHDTTKEAVRLRLGRFNPAKYPKDTVYFDCIEIYRDKYLFGAKGAKYAEYVDKWVWEAGKWVYKDKKWGQTGTCRPVAVKKKGIVVTGKGVGLADIHAAIGNPKLFSYDAAKKTATCRTNLVVASASELVIKGQTLKFDPPGKNYLQLALEYGAALKIEDSTVTSVSRPFLWRFCGTTHYGFPLSLTQKPARLTPLNFASLASVTIKNSTIENSAHFFLESPNKLHLENVKFVNLQSADIGAYTAPPGEVAERKKYVMGRKSFWLSLGDMDVHEMSIKGVTFRMRLVGGGLGSIGRNDHPVDPELPQLTFMLNDAQEKWNLYDVDAGECCFTVKAGRGIDWKLKPRHYKSTLGLVNAKFVGLAVLTDNAWVAPKYYLDVKVVDARGKPVAGAKVTVTNEVDVICRPENMEHFRIETGLRNEKVYKTLRRHLPISETKTTAAGHTPGPSDPVGTMILTDFLQSKSGKKEYKYTITVESGGRKKVITGVNPGPEWYRPDPNKPTYTITAVLDGKVVTEADLKKGK